MSTNAASMLVGNRVYNGGTNNPTSGTVDPSGYIQRELNQSNRRSGLAATALRAMQSRQGSAPNSTPTPQPTQPINPAIAQASFAHQVQVTPTGRLQLISNADPTSQSNVLPFDPNESSQQLGLQNQYQNQLDQLTQGRQQLAEGVTDKERQLDIQAPDLFRKLLNNYAGRGMAYSSGYGYGYGQEQDSLANQKAALERQLQEGLANYDLQQQGDADQYQLALSQLQANSAYGMNPSDIQNLSGQGPVSGPVAPVTKGLGKKPKPTNPHQAAAKRLSIGQALGQGIQKNNPFSHKPNHTATAQKLAAKKSASKKKGKGK